MVLTGNLEEGDYVTMITFGLLVVAFAIVLHALISKMPAGLEKIVKELQAKGYNTNSAWAIGQTIWKKKKGKNGKRKNNPS